MVPTKDGEQKEKNTFLEQIERTKRRDPLKRKSKKPLPDQFGLDSHRSLLAALNTPVFDSKRLKGKRMYSPESHVDLAKELPNHKVGAELIFFAFCVIIYCRFWWIVS